MNTRLSLLLVLPLAACASSERHVARVYPGFGAYTRAVSTDSAEAQRWFDQGIQLMYGFNHDEAIRSFRAAADADPQCAMAWWGIAYANGLDINNAEITEEEAREAHTASREAARHLSRATPVEIALVDAIQARYEWPNPEDRAHLDQAYADAMHRAWQGFSDDPDVGALFAESLMNLQPWDYWEKDGAPKGRTSEIVAALERVLALRPDHPGANHFYIHAIEASHCPELGIEAADRLSTLVPGAGHLVHMPAHIYARVGRYDLASDQNERAIAADKAYFELAPPPDFYSLYFVHNIHFLTYAAMMEGRYATAMAAGRELESQIPQDFLEENVSFADGFMPTPLHVMIRFGRWEEILAEPEPPKFRKFSRAMRHYARGVALAALERPAEARAELAAFEKAAAAVPDDWKVGNNTAGDVLAIARTMLQAELAYREGHPESAFSALSEGVRLEGELVYDEPPGWLQPVRHAQGALLLASGRAEEAEAVYGEDLLANRENGWALLGLERALLALGRGDEVARVRQRLDRAWSRADVSPTSSCYCAPAPQG
jgi:tetratricopeptide (TPR) repeat protein